MEKLKTIDAVKNDLNTMLCSTSSMIFNQKWEEIKNSEFIMDWACSVHHDKDGYEKFNSPSLCSFILDLQEECMLDERVKHIYEKIVDEIYASESIASTYCVDGETFLSKVLRNHNIELTENQKKKALRTAEDYILAAYNDGLDVTDLPEFDVRFEILRNPNWSTAEKYQLLNNFYSCPENFDYFMNLWFYGLSNAYDVTGNKIGWEPQDMLFYDFDELRCMFAGSNEEPTKASDVLAERSFENIKFLKEMSILRTAYVNGLPRIKVSSNK